MKLVYGSQDILNNDIIHVGTLLFGSTNDTNLYRPLAVPNRLKTDDDFECNNLIVNGTIAITGLVNRFEHTQAVTSVTWNINHNLGKRLVAVDIFDTSYTELEYEDLICVDANNCQVTFVSPQTGYALVLG